MPRTLDEDGVRRLLRQRWQELGTWRAVAADLGLSETYIHGVVRKHKGVSANLAGRLGLERRVRFVRVEGK